MVNHLHVDRLNIEMSWSDSEIGIIDLVIANNDL